MPVPKTLFFRASHKGTPEVAWRGVKEMHGHSLLLAGLGPQLPEASDLGPASPGPGTKHPSYLTWLPFSLVFSCFGRFPPFLSVYSLLW